MGAPFQGLYVSRQEGWRTSSPAWLNGDLFMLAKSSLIGIAAGVAFSASGAHAATLYSNNFDSGSVAGLSGPGATSADIVNTGNPTYGSYLYLASQGGPDSAGTATLTLDTAGYSSVTVTFDVYAINTVDGDGPFGGNSPSDPDAFITAVTGGPTLENYSFANYGGDTQDYPGMQGPPTPGEPPQTGATAVGQFPSDGGDDAIYAFSYTFSPTGNSTSINFTGQTNQGLGDESFGLDNLTVTGVPGAVPGVPEPGAWMLMLCGVGFAGCALRSGRRRGAVAAA